MGIDGNDIIIDRIEDGGTSDWLEEPVADLKKSIKMGTMED